MRTVLVLGAGRSSGSLIDYLIRHASAEQWKVVVGDADERAAADRIGGAAVAAAIRFDAHGADAVTRIQQADLVISLLPPPLHPVVAALCVQHGKPMLTASYVSAEMKALDAEAKKRGLLLLNECGLDPGIDHMSAMQVMDRIRKKGGKITSFESFTGGLIAPDTDPENPWRYKFTWNPRNVVMAGQGTAKFLQEGAYKYIPYQQLFRRITPVEVPGLGSFEGYANRDSLSYRETYGLQDIRTMVRGTLRHHGFCAAWDVLVQLGCTDDSYQMEGVAQMTHLDFVNAFLEYHPEWSVEEKLMHRFHLKPEGPELTRLNWSGLFDNEVVGRSNGTPAQVLEHILHKRWSLQAGDRDMIVMWHRFGYLSDGQQKEIQATLVASGTSQHDTAMSRTVGLPLGIAARLVLAGKIKRSGVCVPVTADIYEPVLQELATMGIALRESGD